MSLQTSDRDQIVFIADDDDDDNDNDAIRRWF